MMIMTQKVLMLSFDIYDEQKAAADKKRDDDAQDAVNNNVRMNGQSKTTKSDDTQPKVLRPSLLEFSSYVINFHSIQCGPFCFYSDYLAFVEGRDYWSQSRGRQMHGNLAKESPTNIRPPSALPVVVKKVVVSLIFLFTGGYMTSVFPSSAVFEGEWTLIGQSVYLLLTFTLVRTQYYFAWIMADAVSNASGFGFNGYAENGEPRWDLVTNVDVLGVEAGTNMRNSLEKWNINTVIWLRACAFNRTPPAYRTLATFVMSAWWHGFFPGYYITFLSAAFFTLVARIGRRRFRPYVLDHPSWQVPYDALTFLASRIAFSASCVSFVFLDLRMALKVFKDTYCLAHVCGIALLFLVPLMVPKKKSAQQKCQ